MASGAVPHRPQVPAAIFAARQAERLVLFSLMAKILQAGMSVERARRIIAARMEKRKPPAAVKSQVPADSGRDW